MATMKIINQIRNVKDLKSVKVHMLIKEINLLEPIFKKLHNKTLIIIIKFKKQAESLSKKLFQI